MSKNTKYIKLRTMMYYLVPGPACKLPGLTEADAKVENRFYGNKFRALYLNDHLILCSESKKKDFSDLKMYTINLKTKIKTEIPEELMLNTIELIEEINEAANFDDDNDKAVELYEMFDALNKEFFDSVFELGDSRGFEFFYLADEFYGKHQYTSDLRAVELALKPSAKTAITYEIKGLTQAQINKINSKYQYPEDILNALDRHSKFEYQVHSIGTKNYAKTLNAIDPHLAEDLAEATWMSYLDSKPTFQEELPFSFGHGMVFKEMFQIRGFAKYCRKVLDGTIFDKEYQEGFKTEGCVLLDNSTMKFTYLNNWDDSIFSGFYGLPVSAFNTKVQIKKEGDKFLLKLPFGLEHPIY
ncbi:hypothetical protein [Mycoplasma seminis]|uniref:Uncharacterized protein n=1 Tax=Mycoplasma seminis TaxID=512749 RepID=A0ABY9HDL1_9MOLU|nr:hypothetical protein [Mycoplasma seminis]WLP85773.1 hypothetical protein Q8852_01320 [Mycoplasma seminis]